MAELLSGLIAHSNVQFDVSSVSDYHTVAVGMTVTWTGPVNEDLILVNLAYPLTPGPRSIALALETDEEGVDARLIIYSFNTPTLVTIQLQIEDGSPIPERVKVHIVYLTTCYTSLNARRDHGIVDVNPDGTCIVPVTSLYGALMCGLLNPDGNTSLKPIIASVSSSQIIFTVVGGGPIATGTQIMWAGVGSTLAPAGPPGDDSEVIGHIVSLSSPLSLISIDTDSCPSACITRILQPTINEIMHNDYVIKSVSHSSIDVALSPGTHGAFAYIGIA